MHPRIPELEVTEAHRLAIRPATADRPHRAAKAARTRRGPHRVNAGFTLLARLVPTRVDAARALLASFARLEPFDGSETTHFATITIIPEQQRGTAVLPAMLLFATSYCGPTGEHLRELTKLMGHRLRDLFQHCEGFDCAGDLERFMREHRHGDTFYSGMQHLTPRDVRRHQALRAAIEAFVDRQVVDRADRPAPTAEQLRRAIQAHIRTSSDFGWALEPFEPPLVAWWILRWRSLVALAVLGAALLWAPLSTLATLAVAAAVLMGATRYAEHQQTYVSGRQPDDRVRELAATQAHPVINELTICGPVKEGSLRPLVMRLILWIVARAAEGLPAPTRRLRELLSINIPTVATARWIAADRGRRLIFLSNYTNAAEPYIRDFIDPRGGAARINATFGFGQGYPKTKWIFGAGAASDPIGFVNVALEQQHPTSYWYCPYRDLSIDNIKVNRQIREGLFAESTPAQAQAWLDLLGGSLGPARAPARPVPAPAQDEQLDTADIQGLLVRGYGPLPEARFLLLDVAPPDVERARAYLRDLAARINPASDSPRATALQIAFTAPGLLALGIPASAYRTFAREFLEGMTDRVRAEALGDASSVLGWSDATVHALLMVYAADADTLARQLAVERAALTGAFRIVREEEAKIRDDHKEHFGWRDGISTPTIEGIESSRAKADAPERWTEKPIRPGEFVLGYRNEYDGYPESPVVELADDPEEGLPFTPDRAHKDLGKNGSYLVYRELEQDVPAFWRYLAEHSREPGADRTASAVALGAKMVGRWPGGAPLVAAPDRDDPALADHNAFRYGDDPAGLRCPVGAHIRRANPRDVLAADRDADASVAMVRKHQLLRRGRSFGPPVSPALAPDQILAQGDDHARRGLHFVCLVGQIGRQFETVQRAWIQSPNFAGLFRDGDPLIAGRHGGDNPDDRFTCPAHPVRRTYKRLPQFTKLVGGGYFFLPSLRALRYIAR